MYKKVLNLVIVASLVSLFISSCQKGDSTYKVGLLMDDYVQERWEKDRDLLIKEVEKRGGVVEVEVASGDQEKQIEQAKKLLQKDVDVLVVVPVNHESAAEIVKAAHKKRAKVIAYDRLIKNCDLDFYISFDNVKVGVLQAQHLLKNAPEGDFALINGPKADNNSYLLKIGQLSVLQPKVEDGDINIIYDVFVDEWEGKEGYKHMKKCRSE